jgi:predicted dehydrogenase
LAGSAAAGAAVTMWSRPLRAQGANDDVRVAVIGFRGRGADHIKELLNVKGVRLVGLCDADQRVIDSQINSLEKREKPVKVEYTTQDLRKLLERNDIDAVTTATPNHWHALVTILALQAGKDVYCEKPVSHNIWEGRQASKLAEKSGKIVYCGTQRRSDKGFQEAVDYVQSGKLGKILYARGFCYKERGSIGKVKEPTPIPSEVDYEMWCGPSPKGPLMRKQLHYDWHWVWETGNGDIGNQGIHEVDQCRWMLGQKALAPRVFSFGGRFLYDDDATTPNTLVSVYDYQPAPMIFEVRGLPRSNKDEKPIMDVYKHGDIRIGVVVKCEHGYVASGNNGGFAYDNDDKKIETTDGKKVQFLQKGASEHIANYIKAVRSRKASDITAPYVEGHISSALCHMGNISYRVGKQLGADEVAERVKGDKNAMDSLDRMKQHLAANGLDLEKEKIVLGPSLSFDPQAERFTGEMAEEANKLLKDHYRAPFAVPENV